MQGPKQSRKSSYCDSFQGSGPKAVKKVLMLTFSVVVSYKNGERLNPKCSKGMLKKDLSFKLLKNVSSRNRL